MDGSAAGSVISIRLEDLEAPEILRRLICQPSGGSWPLAQIPGPDLTRSLAILGAEARVVLIGEAACGVRVLKPVWWEGKSAQLGYLTLLRRDPMAPLIPLLRAAPAAFSALRSTCAADELPWDLTAILDGNAKARRLLTRGLPGWPPYRRRASFACRAWSRPRFASLRQSRPDWRVRSAVLADLPALVDLARPPPGVQLWPRRTWNASDLDHLLVAEAGGDLLACAGLDDQRSRRTMVLTGMPAWARITRPVLNLARKLRGLPAIPRPGAIIDQRHLDRWYWRHGLVAAAVDCAARLAADSTADILVGGWGATLPEAATLAAMVPGEDFTATWYAVGGPDEALRGTWHLEAGTM